MNPTDFVEFLVKSPSFDSCQHLYGNSSGPDRRRKANLILYLEYMQKVDPKVMLLGEAPGHRGCGRTGIPFVCEKTLSESSFFRKGNFTLPQPSNPVKEATAQTVWGSLVKWNELPLLWNIFPFHPHKPGLPESNRPPTKPELEFGEAVLLELLSIFSIRKILAVGKKAEGQLAGLGIPYQYIRHPSFGGKRDFEKGMAIYQKNL